MVNLNDSTFRIATQWHIASMPINAGWAGGGYGGTLRPSAIEQGQGAQILASGGTLSGWDRYAQLVAESYAAAPMRSGDGVKAFKTFQTHIVRMFTRMQSKVRVEFVDYDPYANATEMKEDIKRTGVLKVYSGDNQAEAWDRPEINLMLRAVHDFAAHLGAMGRGKIREFSLKGEFQAYNKHVNLIGCNSIAGGALFTEIIGQVSYFHHYGRFPKQKIVTLPQFDWCKLGLVDGYRIVDGDLVPL